MVQGLLEQLLHLEYAHLCQKEGSFLADNPARLRVHTANRDPEGCRTTSWLLPIVL